MATRFDNTLHMSNTLLADFQGWVMFIHNLLVTNGGWIQTADTGQMTTPPAAAPSAANQQTCYAVYRMNDALQGTAPIFMRIAYGSSNFGTGTPVPAFWVTLGTGSNGAGVITGIFYNGQANLNSTVSASINATSLCNSYGSADVDRVHLLMFVRAGADDCMFFSLERTKDATGATNSDGVVMIWGRGALNQIQYLMRTGAIPPVENGLSVIMSNLATSAFSANVGIGLPIPMKGFAMPPGTGIVLVNGSDFVAEANFQMVLYGAVRTYQTGNSSNAQAQVALGNNTLSNRAVTRVGIRYD
jgi:hypothetical protein